MAHYLYHDTISYYKYFAMLFKMRSLHRTYVHVILQKQKQKQYYK